MKNVNDKAKIYFIISAQNSLIHYVKTTRKLYFHFSPSEAYLSKPSCWKDTVGPFPRPNSQATLDTSSPFHSWPIICAFPEVNQVCSSAHLSNEGAEKRATNVLRGQSYWNVSNLIPVLWSGSLAGDDIHLVALSLLHLICVLKQQKGLRQSWNRLNRRQRSFGTPTTLISSITLTLRSSAT